MRGPDTSTSTPSTGLQETDLASTNYLAPIGLLDWGTLYPAMFRVSLSWVREFPPCGRRNIVSP